MTDKTLEIIQTLRAVADIAAQGICPHEDTYRGGAIWEICRDCNTKWSDDEGGRPADAGTLPKEITDALRLASELEARLEHPGHKELAALIAAQHKNRNTPVPDGNNEAGPQKKAHETADYSQIEQRVMAHMAEDESIRQQDIDKYAFIKKWSDAKEYEELVKALAIGYAYSGHDRDSSAETAMGVARDIMVEVKRAREAGKQ